MLSFAETRMDKRQEVLVDFCYFLSHLKRDMSQPHSKYK